MAENEEEEPQMRINGNRYYRKLYLSSVSVLARAGMLWQLEVIQKLVWKAGQAGIGLPQKFFDIERDWVYNIVGCVNLAIVIEGAVKGEVIEEEHLVYNSRDALKRIKAKGFSQYFGIAVEKDSAAGKIVLDRFSRDEVVINDLSELNKELWARVESGIKRLVGADMEKASVFFDGYYLYSIGHYGHLDALIRTAELDEDVEVVIKYDRRLCLSDLAMAYSILSGKRVKVLGGGLPYLNLYRFAKIYRDLNNGRYYTRNNGGQSIKQDSETRRQMGIIKSSSIKRIIGETDSYACVHLRGSRFKGWNSIRDSREHDYYTELYDYLLGRFERIFVLGDRYYDGLYDFGNRLQSLASHPGLTFDDQVRVIENSALTVGSLSGATHITSITKTPVIAFDCPHYGNMLLPKGSRHLVKLPLDRKLRGNEEPEIDQQIEAYKLLMKYDLNELRISGDRDGEYLLTQKHILNNTPVSLIIKAIESVGVDISCQHVPKDDYKAYVTRCNSKKELQEIGLYAVEYQYL